MKVFISWSGTTSREVAELFRWWLKCVIQACDPWISTEDIESGAFWFNEISAQLSETSVGIICLSRENKDKPWILFEAGALTKGLSTNRVIPFLIDLEPHEIYPPLSQLNAITPNEKGLTSLVRTVNLQLKDNSLAPDVLKAVFETYWPQFEARFNEIKTAISDQPKSETRKDKDILSEILLTVRGFDKRIRNIEDSGTTGVNKIIDLSSNNGISNERKVLKKNIRDYINNYFKMNNELPGLSNILENLEPIFNNISQDTLRRMIITEVSMFKNYIESRS